MTRIAQARFDNRRIAPGIAVASALLAAAFGLASCATMGNPPASGVDSPLDATSQSNLTSLSEVIAKHPDDPQAYNMRGSVFGESGRSAEALADFDKAISLDPNYAQAYANRALIYRKTGKLDLALADDNKALAIDRIRRRND